MTNFQIDATPFYDSFQIITNIFPQTFQIHLNYNWLLFQLFILIFNQSFFCKMHFPLLPIKLVRRMCHFNYIRYLYQIHIGPKTEILEFKFLMHIFFIARKIIILLHKKTFRILDFYIIVFI